MKGDSRTTPRTAITDELRDRPRDGRTDDSLHRLLDVAFDGWGDRSYYAFKYTDFPGYDPDEHSFRVERDDRIVAARRVFAKRLLAGEESHPIHVHGGAAVHPEYRERGLFTDLVDEARTFSRDAGSPVVMTFNRRGKISTAAHMRRNWQYRTLPLHILPLSPAALVEEHADEVLPDVPGLETAADIAGRVAAGVLPLWAIARGIETATSGSIRRPIFRTGNEAFADQNVTIRPYESGDVDAVCDLFDREIDRYDLAFARGPEHVRHMVGYERAESVVVEQEGTVVGFASVGIVDRGDHLEARVFDLVHATSAIGDRLLDWVEASARRRDADVVSVVRDERPDRRWASLETDLVMWDYLQGRDEWHRPLTNGNWRITAYDVL